MDFKLVWADEANPSKSGWTDFVPHKAGRFIVGAHAYRDFFVRLERVEANNRIVITERGARSMCSLPKDLRWATLT